MCVRAAPIGSGQALAGALACSIVALALSCWAGPETEERPVFVYSPRACPISQSDALSVIHAGGDFEPSADRPPTASVFLREVGKTMDGLPRETRSVVVDVSLRDAHWSGLTDIPDRGPIHVLVWPTGEACRLTRDVERRTEMTLAVLGPHFMVTGGRSLDGSRVPNTYVGALTTGAIEPLAFGQRARRSWPTLTPFGPPTDGHASSAALLAGGEDPDSGAALATAEIYVPKIGAPSGVGDFDGQRVDLSEPRTRHAAVVLTTGETLLVGGVGPAGPLRTMEIVDPITRRTRTSGVALLRVARRAPSVVRLSTGEILVAGGVDSNGDPVPTLEWFSPDASRPTRRPVDLVTGRRRAIVPLEAGGALAVILPEVGSPPDFKTVWVISADGTLEPAHPVDPSTMDAVRLFPGADGAPALWTGRQWMRWAPWLGAFQPIAGAPDRGPNLDAIASGDPGLALWLEDRQEAGMSVTGFRFAARTRFDAVPKPLLVTGPDRLAPDRIAGLPGSAIRFEPDRGLLLGPGASAFLTDVTFADFDLEVDVTRSSPSVILRLATGAELEVGGAGCAFAQAARRHLKVERRGRRIEVRVDGAAPRACPTELERDERVSLGLRGAQGVDVSDAHNLVVTRR